MAISEQKDLKNWKKTFFPIWVGQAVSQLGSRLVGFAFVWHLTSMTGSAVVLTTATLMSIIPDVIISPFVGALVDRWDRKKVLVITDLLTALFTLILALLFAFTEVKIWQIYTIMFLRALFGTFQWPAMLTATSLIVPKEQLARISGMNQTLAGAMGILSPPLGAFIVGLLPMWGVLSIDVITALLAVIPLLIIQIPKVHIAHEENLENRNAIKRLFEDLGAGIKYVISLPGLLTVIFVATLINFLVSPAFSLLPLVITNHFNKNVIELGIAESIFSIGFLLGGLTLSIWGGFKNRIMTSCFFLVVMGAAITLFGLMPASTFNLALVFLGLAGISNPLVNGPLMAALQARVDPDKQGRVFTLLNAGAGAAMPLGLALAGQISSKVGITIWFIVGGLVCALMGFLLFLNKKVIQLGIIPSGTEINKEDTPIPSEAGN